jgi:hypothetical protein
MFRRLPRATLMTVALVLASQALVTPAPVRGQFIVEDPKDGKGNVPERASAASFDRGLDAFRTEDALDPLRGRDDLKLLMMDLAMPADPFAAAR